MPIIPSTQEAEAGNCYEFEAGPGYIMSSRPPGLEKDPAPKTKIILNGFFFSRYGSKTGNLIQQVLSFTQRISILVRHCRCVLEISTLAAWSPRPRWEHSSSCGGLDTLVLMSD